MARKSATINVAGLSGFQLSGDTFAMTFFGLMVSLPFLVPYHTLPIPSFQSEWLAMFLGLMGLLPVVIRKNATPLYVPYIAMAPAALILVVLLQLTSGMFAYAASAYTIVMYLLWSVLLAVAGRTLVTRIGEKRMVTYLAWFLLAGGCVNAIFGLLQYLQLSHAVGDLVSEPMSVAVYGVYGNLAQQNHFATHIALSIVSASYLCFSRQLATRWYCASSVVLLIALALSGSRSGFLYLAWITVISAWLTRMDIERHISRRIGWSAIGIFTTIVGALWVASRYSATVPQIERLLTISGAIGPRVYLWRHALSMFLENPLLGVGFDSFAYYLVGQLQMSEDTIVWGIDQYAHNLPLQLLAVSGICGFVAVAWPGILFLRRQIVVPYTVERMWGCGVIGILLIHSMLEQPLFYAYFLGIAAFVAGMSDPSAWVDGSGTKSKAFVAAISILALVFLCKTANDYDNIEGTFYSGRYVNANDTRQLEFRKKIVLGLHAYSIFSPLAELISPGDFVPASASAREKIALNSRVMHYAPIAETEYRQSALLAEDGRTPEAMIQFKRAAYAYPNEVREYLERFNVLASQDFATYGQLAAYANDLVMTKGLAGRP